MPRLTSYFPLAAGVLINFAVGLIYAWSILVAPLEAALEVPRAAVSAAQSLSLLLATVGTFVMHRMLRLGTLAQLALAMMVLSAAGLAMAGFGNSLPTLLIGYGLLFGFGAGVAYFVAMTAASIDGPVPRSLAIGINMSAVAIGGMIWAPILTSLVTEIGPHQTICVAAAIVLGAGGLAFALLYLARAAVAEETGAVGLFHDILTDQPRVFLTIFLGFLLISFGALSAIGHAAPLIHALDATGPSQFAPILSSAGYALGALVGGSLTDLLGGRRVLLGIAGIIGGILLLLFAAPSVTLGLVALALVGGCFGATASAHPVTVGYYYGMAAMPRVYGRVAIAYGVGGLLGPFATGAIYDAEGRYDTAIVLVGVLGLLGALAYGSLPREKPKNAEVGSAP